MTTGVSMSEEAPLISQGLGGGLQPVWFPTNGLKNYGTMGGVGPMPSREDHWDQGCGREATVVAPEACEAWGRRHRGHHFQEVGWNSRAGDPPLSLALWEPQHFFAGGEEALQFLQWPSWEVGAAWQRRAGPTARGCFPATCPADSLDIQGEVKARIGS